MTNLVYPPAGATGIEFYAENAPISVDLWQLSSAWR